MNTQTFLDRLTREQDITRLHRLVRWEFTIRHNRWPDGARVQSLWHRRWIVRHLTNRIRSHQGRRTLAIFPRP